MVILGVDPGSRATGYGFIDSSPGKLRCLAYGALKPPKTAKLAQRLQHVWLGLSDLIATHRPELAAVETVFYAKNVRSALILAQVRGVVLLAAMEAGCEISEYAPTDIKRAVSGYGRAEKSQVQVMVKALLGLDSLPQPEDAADALAAAICHAQTSRLMRGLVGSPGASLSH